MIDSLETQVTVLISTPYLEFHKGRALSLEYRGPQSQTPFEVNKSQVCIFRMIAMFYTSIKQNA